MTSFQIMAILLTFAAVGGYLNCRFIGLPATIGHMAFALILSLLAIVCGKLGWFDLAWVKTLVGQIDFSKLFLHGMLSFLLFAGALHIKFDDLKSVKWSVGTLATVGVVLATAITSTLTWLAAHLIGINLSYIDALLFGALISPTDPIAVLSILRHAGISKRLYTQIGGESLFNDGVGVVLFLAILGAAVSPSSLSIKDFLIIFGQQSLGGLALGLVLGWIVYRLLRPIDDYKVEVMLTLALVAGGYALAEYLDMSAPLCMVAAGLIIGNKARAKGMSEETIQHLDIFWELIDEILNAVLFLLIGLEIMIIPLSHQILALGVLAIAAVLIARWISVGLPISVIRLWKNFEPGTIRLLTWGGLRGGLSIAMALALPVSSDKWLILALTYIVVLFSIMVQGLSFRRVIPLVIKN